MTTAIRATFASALAEAESREPIEGTEEVANLPAMLVRASGIINQMLDRLRSSQDVLQQAAVSRLHDTSAQLTEISSTTETAATDIMDGVDRALALVDELESEGESGKVADTAALLRDELFGLVNHLQFQDITTQQLNHAASTLHDLVCYLAEFAKIFDLESFGRLPTPQPRPRQDAPVTFDPAATTRKVEERQALVDQLLAGG